jgi:hypothetical protein
VAAAALALGLAAQLAGTPAAAAPATAAPAQATPRPTDSPVTVTGLLVDGDGVCGASWRVQRCGDNALVPVRSDMDISPFRGSLVRVQGLPADCAVNGRSYLWLSSVEPVADCAPPTPTPVASPTPALGSDLALNRPVIASADDPAAPARHAVDGDPGTAWVDPGHAAWIYVDLGQERTFSRMRLGWGLPHALRYGIFVLEYGEWAFKYEVDGSDGGVDEFVIPRLYGRYVLLYAVESASPAGGYSLNSWEIYGQETPNLAFGQSVSVSDALDGYPGHLANDGQYDTGWASLARPPRGPGEGMPWLLLRLAPGTPVVELRATWDYVAFPWVYRVVFYDGEARRALQLRSIRGGQHLVSWPLPVRADAILLYTDLLPSVGQVALAELEVYGPNTVGAAGRPYGRLTPSRQEGVTWRWLSDPLELVRGLLPGPPIKVAPDALTAPAPLRPAMAAPDVAVPGTE